MLVPSIYFFNKVGPKKGWPAPIVSIDKYQPTRMAHLYSEYTLHNQEIKLNIW